MVLNLFIHNRLCKIRLILLIMAVPSVPNNIDEDVLLEFLSVLHRNLHALVQNVRLVSIHVDHRSISCFGDLGAVVR